MAKDKTGSIPGASDILDFNNFNEYGRVGQRKFAGVFFEEFETKLQGIKGVEVYKEMSDNDDVIGAILFAIEMLIKQVDWTIEPAGNQPADKKAAEFAEECLKDLDPGWQDTISEILSFLTYGWSIHEICYKRRMGANKKKKLNSKYSDGLIGWQKFSVRSQDTLFRWEYDVEDELIGISQMAPPDYQVRTIPLEKCLHFRTKSRKENPEGRSVLRNAYKDYYFKKRMQVIEGIGVERDLAGLPVVTPPEDVNLFDKEDPESKLCLQYAQNLVSSIRRDSIEGIVKPSGWEVNLLNGGSRRQFEIGNIIERYDKRMAMTVMADFIFLGHQETGSFALSSNKTKLFSTAIGSYLDIICEVMNNQAIPRLINLNGDHFKGISDYPQMVHSDIEKQDIQRLASYVSTLTKDGLLTPSVELEKFLRREADLPELVEGAEYPPVEENPEKRKPQNSENSGENKKSNVNTTENKKEAETGDNEPK